MLSQLSYTHRHMARDHFNVPGAVKNKPNYSKKNISKSFNEVVGMGVVDRCIKIEINITAKRKVY